MDQLRRHARRWLLAGLAATTAAGCGASADAGTGPPAGPVRSARGGVADRYAQHFGAAPKIDPAVVRVLTGGGGSDAGFLFAAPRPYKTAQGGPMIFDDQGQVVWFRALPKGEQAIDFRVQRYKGRPVLTWGQRPVAAHAGAYWSILDDHYRGVARVRAGAGDGTDLHYMQITPHNNALLIGYRLVRRNLSAYGGSSYGLVLDGTIQDVSIKTGRVLWRWSALDHVPLSESEAQTPRSSPWDAYHINSVDMDSKGRYLLVSMRHTSTLYAIDLRTGKVKWRMGGNHSNFALSSASRFHFQHDAQWAPGNRISLFDNGATDHTKVESSSSGKLLQVDYTHHKVSLARAYRLPKPILSTSQGTYQTLSGNHVFIGWGKLPYLSEFSPTGDLLFEAKFPTIGQQSYSAHRYVWTGHPLTKPTVVVGGHRPKVTLSVLWNGSTQVAQWRVLGGATPNTLLPLGIAPRAGYETILHVDTLHHYVAVQALDSTGRVIGHTAALATKK